LLDFFRVVLLGSEFAADSTKGWLDNAAMVFGCLGSTVEQNQRLDRFQPAGDNRRNESTHRIAEQDRVDDLQFFNQAQNVLGVLEDGGVGICCRTIAAAAEIYPNKAIFAFKLFGIIIHNL